MPTPIHVVHCHNVTANKILSFFHNDNATNIRLQINQWSYNMQANKVSVLQNLGPHTSLDPHGTFSLVQNSNMHPCHIYLFKHPTLQAPS